MGNGEIRTIASGLRGVLTEDQMLNAMVVVVCNLKPRAMGSFTSAGMVLCGQLSDKSKCDLLSPPAGSKPGDIITFEGVSRDPPAQLPAKKSPWETVQPKLAVNAQGVCVWDDKPFTTPSGQVTVPNVRNGIIS